MVKRNSAGDSTDHAGHQTGLAYVLVDVSRVHGQFEPSLWAAHSTRIHDSASHGGTEAEQFRKTAHLLQNDDNEETWQEC